MGSRQRAHREGLCLRRHAGAERGDGGFAGQLRVDGRRRCPLRRRQLPANEPHGEAEALIDKLGERYEIVVTSIKKWTVGSPIQAPLDALEIMQKKRSFRADDVKEVVVRMAPGSVVDNRDMPDICIQHILAVMLIDKNMTFRSAHDKARMQDPLVLRHRAKVRLDPGAAGPRVPLVVITLTDGTRLNEDV